jgi:hypothetical protein
MLYRDIIAVCSEIPTKTRKYTVWAEPLGHKELMPRYFGARSRAPEAHGIGGCLDGILLTEVKNLHLFRNPITIRTYGERTGSNRIFVGNLRARDYLEDLGIDGRIILEQIFRK